MLFGDVVRVSLDVGATRSRNAKRDTIAGLIGGQDPGAAEIAVAMLTGQVRQGRIGVGWATIAALDAPPASQGTVTVHDVDGVVDELVRTTGPGSQTARAELLSELWSRCTADEQEFLGRLFVGELRQGALTGVMTDAVARAADVPLALFRRAAMLSGDLAGVSAVALRSGADGLAHVGLSVGTAIQPMLASTAQSVGEGIDAFGTASVEWKLDGARVQVHRNDARVRVYTRNLNDVTDRSREVVDVVAALDCHQVVLDGEVLGLDGDGRPRAFQDTMSRFGADDAGSHDRVRLTPIFFDVLHLDGVDLIDQPLDERHLILDSLVPQQNRAPRVRTADLGVAESFFADTVEVGHEGVMVKDVLAPYEAGRRGKGWLKVKPVHTYDLVVLAAEWGHGRRSGWLSNLHLGARTGDDFVMVGKTFKGLTDELLEWQTERLQGIADRVTDDVVWVRPELVVEIAIDGVQRSTRYPGDLALRFARVRQFREDKPPQHADTLDSLRALLR